jgi:hypothetical protein
VFNRRSHISIFVFKRPVQRTGEERQNMGGGVGMLFAEVMVERGKGAAEWTADNEAYGGVR